MRHYFLNGRLYRCPKISNYQGLEFLTDAQETFLTANPGAKVHEIRACMLDADKPVDMEALQAAAKHQVDSMAEVRLSEMIDARQKEIAFVVVQLGQDGAAMTLEDARAFLQEYDRINAAVLVAKTAAYAAIDGATTPAELDEIVLQFSEQQQYEQASV